MKSFKEYFKKMPRGNAKVEGALIGHARIIWRASLFLLAALLVAALLFDGYVFLFYAQDIERSVDVGDAGTLPDIKKPLLAEARQILARRTERMKNLDADLPARNPFLEKEEKKK